MKIEERNKAKVNASLLLNDVKELKGEPRAFLEGMLTGRRSNTSTGESLPIGRQQSRGSSTMGP